MDYTSGYWASPTIDLAYLLYSSASADISSNDFHELINHYHKELSDNLSILNYSAYIPSLDELNEELGINSVPIIAITTIVNGFRLSENHDNVRMLSEVEGTHLLIGLLSTYEFKKRMAFLLKYYDSMSYLD